MIAPRNALHEPSTRREFAVLRGLSHRPAPSSTRDAADGSSWRANHSTSQHEPRFISEKRRLALRVLFALDVIGAGVPGLLLLVSSEKAIAWLLADRIAAGSVTALLGCVWLSMGLLAIAGMFRPVTLSPLLLLQLLYKGIWLGTVGATTYWNGGSPPPIMTAVFLAWVIAVAATLPWRFLFANEDSAVFSP